MMCVFDRMAEQNNFYYPLMITVPVWLHLLKSPKASCVSAGLTAPFIILLQVKTSVFFKPITIVLLGVL